MTQVPESAATGPAAPSGPAYLRIIGLAALIGLPAALLAVGFLALVHVLEDLLWTQLPEALGQDSPPWYLVIGLPLVGAALVWFARRFLPGDGGHDPLHGISVEPTPFRAGPGVALAALGSLSFGAVLGPEAPLIALGSVVGLAITPYIRASIVEQKLLATAGSFSAVSALFGGPLVAGMLLVEAGVGMGAALLPALLPGLVASSIGYLVFIGFGDWGGIQSATLTVPGLPLYEGFHIVDLVLAIVVGGAVAILVVAVRRVAAGVQQIGTRPRIGLGPLLLLGGLAVGVLAQVSGWLGADPVDVLFSGETSIPAVIAETSTWALLLLVAAKAIGYAICLGCGFRGGPVFPAIFVGVGLASLGIVWFDVSPTLAVAVGTAAGMAAGTRLLFAPVLFGALIAGTAGIAAVPAAALASCAAWLVTMTLEKRAAAAGTGHVTDPDL